MYYKKVETYQFSVPREYKEYLEFRDELKEAGIKFSEEGGNMFQTITIRTTGDFDKK